jgi:hypothetical protein
MTIRLPHPVRVQRKRSKGWKMPENTVIVDRSTRWGNPFIVSPKVKPGSHSGGMYIAVPTMEDAIECFRELVLNDKGWRMAVRAELFGKNLACWCPLDQPCHADVLLEIANSSTESL